jgi:hypothetical protein
VEHTFWPPVSVLSLLQLHDRNATLNFPTTLLSVRVGAGMSAMLCCTAICFALLHIPERAILPKSFGWLSHRLFALRHISLWRKAESSQHGTCPLGFSYLLGVAIPGDRRRAGGNLTYLTSKPAGELSNGNRPSLSVAGGRVDNKGSLKTQGKTLAAQTTKD